MNLKQPAVYIVSSITRVLYIGVTNNLERRMAEHRSKYNSNSFSTKYHTTKLVYYSFFDSMKDAIGAEKNIKKWRREKKIELIESQNPNWIDLSYEYFIENVISNGT